MPALPQWATVMKEVMHRIDEKEKFVVAYRLSECVI